MFRVCILPKFDGIRESQGQVLQVLQVQFLVSEMDAIAYD